MTALSGRRLEDLQRRGRAPRTQQGDLEAVTPLAQHSRRAPEHLSDEALRQDVRFLRQEQKVAERPFRLHRDGSRCFSVCTRPRPGPGCARVRPQKSQQRPVVWSRQKGRHLLALSDNPTAQLGLRMRSACGLRLTEGTQLQVADIDVHRMWVGVRQAQGRKARGVPRAPRVLEVLRAYWQRARPRPWLCPARQQPAPLSAPSRQKPFKAVVRRRGLPKAASIPTRRPS